MNKMVFPVFLFRFARTGISIRYSVNVKMTMYEFTKNVKNNIMVDFDVHNDCKIEILENGEKEGELGPVVESSDIPFHDYYKGRTPDNLWFYFFLKKKNYDKKYLPNM